MLSTMYHVTASSEGCSALGYTEARGLGKNHAKFEAGLGVHDST